MGTRVCRNLLIDLTFEFHITFNISIVKKVNYCLVVGWDKVGNYRCKFERPKGGHKHVYPPVAHLPSTLRMLDGQQNTHQIFLKQHGCAIIESSWSTCSKKKSRRKSFISHTLFMMSFFIINRILRGIYIAYKPKRCVSEYDV